MKNKIIIYLITTLFVLQCKKKDNENLLIVEKISATSTANGFLEYDVQNVFSRGEWRSELSLFPMDGILVNFLNPDGLSKKGKVQTGARISSMMVECPASGMDAIELYVNGSFLQTTKCNEKTNVDDVVSSLFIAGKTNKKLIEKKSFIISKLRFYHRDKDNKEIEYEINYPEKVIGKVTASSVLEPTAAFQPYFIFDGRTDFAWSEGASGLGIGEVVTVKMDATEVITGLEIFTGFQMSASHFEKNAIPTKLEFSSADYKESFTLDPSYGAQRILLAKPQKTASFSLRILKAKSGSLWQDTLISEVTLLGEESKRFTVYDKKTEEDIQKLKEKLKNTNLSSFMGQAFLAENNGETYKILFRPNASFVIYKNSDEENIVMDGNWIVTTASLDQSRIYIIGKLHKIKTHIVQTEFEGPYGPYNGERAIKEEADFVFSDSITIIATDGKYQLSSQRVNGEFAN